MSRRAIALLPALYAAGDALARGGISTAGSGYHPMKAFFAWVILIVVVIAIASWWHDNRKK